MAVTNKDVRTYITLNNSSIIFFDALVSITPKYTASITTHPIEDRSFITDHVVVKNPKISLTAIMSDADLRGVESVALLGVETVPTKVSSVKGRTLLGGLIREAQDNIPDNVLVEFFSKKPPKVTALANARRKRVENTRSNLLEAYQLTKTVSITEGENTYINLIITSLSFPKNSPEDGVLHIEMDLEEIKTVRSLRETLTNTQVKIEIKEQAAQNTEGGAVTPETKDEDAPENVGVLRQITNSVGITNPDV